MAIIVEADSFASSTKDFCPPADGTARMRLTIAAMFPAPGVARALFAKPGRPKKPTGAFAPGVFSPVVFTHCFNIPGAARS
ncbi:MAG TPA: hypothetical protein VL754_18480 [Verrucomicrobiae bacterium]|nr:hypothetical protein [Verrucomicrobiae bacterium]